MSKVSVLFIGESWFVHTREAKGFDVFSFDYYEESTQWIKKALSTDDISFTHIPCHRVEEDFPATVDELCKYDVVMISDVGANTFHLPMKTFLRGQACPNKLEMVKEFVMRGGGFAMVGGYLTFQGIQARGCYKNTAIEEILPVQLLPNDDRIEKPQGISPEVIINDHPIFNGMQTEEWPSVLGYNRLIPKENAQIIAKFGDDPMITVGAYGKGRTCAYATDCAPHWCPISFCDWEGYDKLWQNIAMWLSGTY